MISCGNIFIAALTYYNSVKLSTKFNIPDAKLDAKNLKLEAISI